ncbi:MAG: class I SAM-dependent DNA methyltransferase [Promethearchaeota archaeon]
MYCKVMKEYFSKSKEIKEKYDATAKHYDVRYQDMQEDKFRAFLKFLYRKNHSYMKQIYPHRNHVKYILDLGCGTGLLLSWLSETSSIKFDHYIGIDISKNMLIFAITNNNEVERGNFIQASVDFLPIRDGTMPLIFSISVFQNLSPLQHVAFFNAVKDAMAENGIFYFSFLNKSPLSEETNKLKQFLGRFFSITYDLHCEKNIEDRCFVCSK